MLDSALHQKLKKTDIFRKNYNIMEKNPNQITIFALCFARDMTFC